MGADHSHRIAWLPCAADGEGDDRAGVASEVVFTAGLESRVPGVAFLYLLEASLLKAELCRVHGVERGGRGVQKVNEVRWSLESFLAGHVDESRRGCGVCS